MNTIIQKPLKSPIRPLRLTMERPAKGNAATAFLLLSLVALPAAASEPAQSPFYSPLTLDGASRGGPAQSSYSLASYRPGMLALAAGQVGGGGSSQDDGASLDEISAKLSNPVSDLWAMFTELDFVGYNGNLNSGGAKFGSRMIFQPIMPIPLYGEGEDEWKLITRPNVPIIFSQPVPKGVDNFTYLGGLGDINLPMMVAPPLGNVIAGVGPNWLFPTATREEFGQQQWGVGPAIVLGYKTKKWLAVTQTTYAWGIGGWGDKPDASSGNLIYIFLYNLPNAWQIGFNPTITYNHNAASGDRWNVPVGLTVSKTVRLGKTPTKFQLAFEYSVVHEEDFGQRFQVRLNVLPVIHSLVKEPIFGGR
jgi:hypothetical protein